MSRERSPNPNKARSPSALARTKGKNINSPWRKGPMIYTLKNYKRHQRMNGSEE